MNIEDIKGMDITMTKLLTLDEKISIKGCIFRRIKWYLPNVIKMKTRREACFYYGVLFGYRSILNWYKPITRRGRK